MTGPINLLQGILAQYKEKLDKIDKERSIISNIIKEVTNISISEKDLEISNNILLIRSHPAKRQIIMFKKIDILSKIQENESLKNILNIK